LTIQVSVVFETATELKLRRQGLAEVGMRDPHTPRGANMAAAAAAAARTRGEEPPPPPELAHRWSTGDPDKYRTPEAEANGLDDPLSPFRGYGPAACDDPEGEMREAVERAARCCFALHAELHNFLAWREEAPPAANGTNGGTNGGGGGSGGGGGGGGGGGANLPIGASGRLPTESGVFPASGAGGGNGGAKEIRLSLHVGLGCGEVSVMHLGGHHGPPAWSKRIVRLGVLAVLWMAAISSPGRL